MNSEKNKKTILIGPTGFLGPAFLRADPSITAVGRSDLPVGLTNKLVKISSDLDFSPLDELEFQDVIFLIGSSDHKILNAHSTMAIEKNVLALSTFLQYLKKSDRRVNKIINFTTMLQYDSSKMNIPCDENQPRNPYVNNYIMSKFISELITEQYRDTFPIIDIRISNVYGPTSLYRPDIVPSLIWQLLETGEASVWNMSPKRDFIFVDDIVRGLLACALKGKPGESYNLASGVDTTILELAKEIIEFTGSKSKIVYKDLPKDDPHRRKPDISLAIKKLNWIPKYDLDYGLMQTIKYFKEISN